jgi:hypothetical protein
VIPVPKQAKTVPRRKAPIEPSESREGGRGYGSARKWRRTGERQSDVPKTPIASLNKDEVVREQELKRARVGGEEGVGGELEVGNVAGRERYRRDLVLDYRERVELKKTAREVTLELLRRADPPCPFSVRYSTR